MNIEEARIKGLPSRVERLEAVVLKLQDRLEALAQGSKDPEKAFCDEVNRLQFNDMKNLRDTYRKERDELQRRNNEQANTILDLQKQVDLLKPWYKYTPELTKSPDETPWEFMQRIQACSDQISSDVNELRMKHEDILTNDEELNEWIMSYPREFK